MDNSKIPQHKRMACGDRVGFKKGGAVLPNPNVLKSGMPETPMTKAKHVNGIPGMKRGGKV